MVFKPLLLTLLLSGFAWADTGFTSTIKVMESDNSPSCVVGQIKFSTGSLTCNGQTAIVSTGGGSGASTLFSYTINNVTTTVVFDASNTSLDNLSDVLGTLVNDIKAAPAPFVLSGFVVTNVTPTTSFDANDHSLDILANFLGSFITTLQTRSLDVYSTTGALYQHTGDADNTSFDDTADIMGSLVASSRGAGMIQ